MIKNYKLLILAFIPAFIWSCNESEDIITGNATEGGLVEVSSASKSYVVGNPGPYSLEFFVHQDEENKINSIDLYKSFVGTEVVTGSDGEDSVVTYTSDEVLDRTIEVSENGKYFIETEYTFDDLRADLTAKGSPLPAEDGNLRIGDAFKFTAIANLANGRKVEQSYTINFTVSTRYAGTYRAVDADYYRIGVHLYDEAIWPDELVIESVDATTYRAVEYIGPFAGNEWYFQIIDGVISYPDKTPDGAAQVLNGEPLITCDSNPGDMTNVNCGNTNYVVNDDVKGKDRLIMSVGYYTGGSGPREFYQVLEKIVD